jgi:hypothetical protein
MLSIGSIFFFFEVKEYYGVINVFFSIKKYTR